MPNLPQSSRPNDQRARAVFTRLTGNRRGSVALQTALIMLVLLGMVSLGVEITFLLMKHRQMQTAADAAAVAGASGIRVSEAMVVTEARAVSSDQGYTHGTDGTVVTVNHPPTKGSHAGDDDAVEVIVSQPQTLSLARLFRTDPYDVGARAVAITQGGYAACILALDPGNYASSLLIWNNAVLASPDCGVAVNSRSSSALALRNNAVLHGSAYVVGGINQANNAVIDGSPVTDHAPELIEDPYADRVLPSTPAQTSATCPNLQPGYYPNGVVVPKNATCTMAPGLYFVDDSLEIGNGATLNGTGGVTLILNNSYAMDIGNNVTIRITAPTSGATAGIAIYSRSTNSALTQTIENNAILTIVGALYFPSQDFLFRNNGTTGNSPCTQLIARHITFRNNASFNYDCAGTGVDPIGGGSGGPKLVE